MRPFALAAPPVLWLIAFFLIPLAIILAYSLGEQTSLTTIAITLTPENYARALKPLYLAILMKSLAFAAITTLACLVLGFPVAVAMAFASPRAKVWLLLLVMLPFWTNLLVRTYALMAILRDQGLINTALAMILPGAAPLQLLFTDFAVVIGLIQVHLPFMVLPLYAALDRLDRSLIEASLDLGASQLTTFARIVVPLAAPGIAAGVIVTFIPALGAYLTPDLLGGTQSQMIANIIERQFKSANDWPFGAALAGLLIGLTLASLTLQSAFARR